LRKIPVLRLNVPRIFLHQTPSNRIPAALRKTPCLLSVESREVAIIWKFPWDFLVCGGPYYETLRLAVDPTNIIWTEAKKNIIWTEASEVHIIFFW
jgi:hypothetical protein